MDINYNEANTKSELVSGLKELIAQEIDNLKKQILDQPVEKRSYFDIIKNWWSNLVHGHDNPKNPYIHRNRLGALGLKEYTLNKQDELKFVLEVVELLAEEQASKTRFEIIVDKWADKLKSKLGSFIKTCFSGNCEMPEPEVSNKNQSDSEYRSTDSTTTTTTPIPKTDSPKKDTEIRNFSIFSDSLNEDQKNQLAKDFEEYTKLSDEEKIKIYNIGNFGTKNIRPKQNNKIPSLGIDLPYFIFYKLKEKGGAEIINPIYSIINTNYPPDSLALQNQNRMQTPKNSIKNSLVAVIKEELKSSASNPKYDELVQTILNVIQTPQIKISPLVWDSLIENKEKIKRFDPPILELMKEFFENQEWDDFIQVINDNKDFKFDDDDEDKKAVENFNIKSLNSYIKEQTNLKLSTTDTFYERILVCLEKMRST